MAGQGLLRGWLHGEGEREDPDEIHLRGALVALRHGVREWSTTHGRQRQLEATLTSLVEDDQPGALRRRVRRELRRLEKAIRLAKDIAEDPERSSVLETANPAVRAAAERGRARHANADGGLVGDLPESEGQRILLQTLRVLGMLTLGVLTMGGVLVAFLGFGCAFECGEAGGLLIGLLGMAIIGLSVWGFMLLAREFHEEARPRLEDGATVLDRIDLLVQSSEPWQPTGRAVAPGQRWRVDAHGITRSARGWAADANGNGVAAGKGALLPGAPEGCLVGRVGDRVFHLGADGAVPTGVEGPLLLAANQDAWSRNRAHGYFAISLLHIAMDA